MIKMPQYSKCKVAILDYILQHSLKQGDLLPSQRDMCRHFGVSLITIRRALLELEQSEIVKLTPGKGMFLAKNLSRVEELGTIVFLDINAPFRQVHSGIHFLHKYIVRHGYRFKSFACGEYPDETITEELKKATGIIVTGVINDAWKSFISMQNCSVVNIGMSEDDHFQGVKTVYSDCGDDVVLAIGTFFAMNCRSFAFLNASETYCTAHALHEAYFSELKKRHCHTAKDSELFVPDANRTRQVVHFLEKKRNLYDCLLVEAGVAPYLIAAMYELDLPKVPIGIVGDVWSHTDTLNKRIFEFGSSISIFKLAVEVLFDSFRQKELQMYPMAKIKNPSILKQNSSHDITEPESMEHEA